MRVPGILIAAPASGSGKTAAACALMAAFTKRGMTVRACKCGPDYIDPMFHREVLGMDSRNLDLFFSSKEELKKGYEEHLSGADLAVTEGVMGRHVHGFGYGKLLRCVVDPGASCDPGAPLPGGVPLACRGHKGHGGVPSGQPDPGNPFEPGIRDALPASEVHA